MTTLHKTTSTPLTCAEVAVRVDRALRTLRAMPDPEWRFLTAGARSNMPAYVYTDEDRRAQAENHSNLDPAPDRFVPTRRDYSDLDVALGWFRSLSPLDAVTRARLIRAGRPPLSLEQKLLWWDAADASLKWIAQRMGVSDETARRRLVNARERLWHIACADWHARHPGPGRHARAAGRSAGLDR